MEIRKGIGVSPGFAVAEALVLGIEQYAVQRKVVAAAEVTGEIARFKKAAEDAAAELAAGMGRLSRTVAKVAGRILESQAVLVRDESLHREITDDISRHAHSAEYATSRVFKKKTKQILDAGVEELAREFTTLENLLLRHLTGAKRDDLAKISHRVIVVAHDLSPAQTVSLDRSKVAGMLTEVGGRTSHTALVAASLGIPAVVGIPDISSDVTTGDVVILDGAEGRVIVNPDEATRKRYEAMMRNFAAAGERLSRELRDLPAVTRDGTAVELLANIEMPEEIESALECGAEGVGLYRTEFLYLGSPKLPEERDHFEAYRRAAQRLGRRRLVIRTLDLGADKIPVDGFPREDNPILGMRGIRLGLERPDLLMEQVRAILRAAAGNQVWMMAPMVSSAGELRKLRDVIDQARRDLKRRGEPHAESLPVGVMIEVPSAAIAADRIAAEADFLSIGTNDLIAYTLAVDRTNEHVARYFQPSHPAVLELLRSVLEVGRRRQKPVAVCGGMSSDVNYTLLLLGLGLRSFSCVPRAIPEVKKIIRSVTVAEAEAIAAKALDLGDSHATIEYLQGETRKILPDVS